MSEYIDLKEKLQKQKIKGLALDLDETLSFTALHWVTQLSEKFGNPDNLSPHEVLSKYRLIQNYPVWQTAEAFAWMEWARNSNDLQKELPLIENSNHIVNKISKIVPIACYLTARPYEVKEGTKHWLEKHGLPKADVLTMPEGMTYEEATSSWKPKVLEKLYPQVLGIVDDNISLLEHLPKDYKGYVFIYDYSNFQSEQKNVFSCPTWEDVLEKVKELF